MSDFVGFFRSTSMLSNVGPLMATLDREGYALYIARCWDENGPCGFAFDWYLSYPNMPALSGRARTHQQCVQAAYRKVHPVVKK